MPHRILTYLEAVGNVGGAVRYTKARMVAYGDGWWAVTVRQVVAPGSGYDPSSYGRFAYFDTTAPGVKEGESPRGEPATGASVQHALAEKCLGSG